MSNSDCWWGDGLKAMLVWLYDTQLQRPMKFDFILWFYDSLWIKMKLCKRARWMF